MQAGYFLSRFYSLIWVLFLFMTLSKKAFRETIFFNVLHPIRTFLNGSFIGGALSLSLVGWNPITVEWDFPVIFAMLLVAATEELAFRGFTLSLLRKSMGDHKAVLAVSLLFGFLHLPSLSYAFSALLAGILLGYAFLSYGIYYVIGWHFCWNCIESMFFSTEIGRFPILFISAICYFLVFKRRIYEQHPSFE